jgi:hypothetical protein
LGQVVVRAAIQTGDAVRDLVAGGEHQHGRPDAAQTQPPAGLKAVDPREHHVENDHVEGDRRGHPQRILATGGDVGERPPLPKAAVQ